MKLIDMTVKGFLNEVDSKSPAPGGGSVSALASSLGCALGRMVAHLTFGKKAYNALGEEEVKAFEKAFEEIGEYKRKLRELIDEDTNAYNLVMGAYKLPKETDEEKIIRKNKIQENLKIAVNTPFEICRYSRKTLENIGVIVKYGNKNAITDVAVATILLFSGIEGGILNVKVNLLSIEDEEYKKDILEKLDTLYSASLKIKNEVLEIVNKELV